MATARAGILGLCALLCSTTLWSSDAHNDELRQLDERIQSLKAEAMQLDVDLQDYQDAALYPASQQLRVFLTMEVFDFSLKGVELLNNGQPVAQHEYTAREVYALRKGGVQQLHLGNIAPGVHKLQARFTGRFDDDDSKATPYEKLVEVSFRKTADPMWLELRIDGSSGRDLKVRIFQREAE